MMTTFFKPLINFSKFLIAPILEFTNDLLNNLIRVFESLRLPTAQELKWGTASILAGFLSFLLPLPPSFKLESFCKKKLDEATQKYQVANARGPAESEGTKETENTTTGAPFSPQPKLAGTG